MLRVEEELRAAAVGGARVGHRDRADLVRQLADELVRDVAAAIKCRKAQQEARARGSTNWQAPPPSVELGKPEPAPGHWRPADEMQTQQPV